MPAEFPACVRDSQMIAAVSFISKKALAKGLRHMRPKALGFAPVLLLLAQTWCAHAATLSVTSATIPSGSSINLSAAGSLDWVHWGLFTSTSVDRKAGVVPLIGNLTALSDPLRTNAYTYIYQFSDNENGYNWTDGSPDAVVTDTTTGVW